ncbi:NACHT domain-containing NTPase [Janthinobacterium sp. LM6]|uniref:NACHT domain-containing protein n=1 Tax=Janthinobacterium sp. LM6 TaxID=1938606 RepID=UPI00123742E0|nr:hypothetical protein [Janthinobacterium sp. LM6]
MAKALAPLMGELVKNSKGGINNAFEKWKANGFAKKLAKKLITADKVKTIWSKDRENSLLSIYYPSKILDDSGLPQTVESLGDFSSGNFVIEGIVGQGKSIFIRYLYLQELAGNGSGTLPIFVELRTLTQKRDLMVHINDAIEKLDINSNIDVFDYLARSGKITLLLDGFDEVNTTLVSDAIERLEFISEKYNDLKIIITSRPSSEIQKSRLFKTVNLARLEDNDQRGFLKKLNLSREKIAEILSAISENSQDIAELITTPLMLTLLVMVYESEKEIPSEVPEFFSKLFTTVFTQHDKLKAGFVREHHSGISERKLQHLFEAFCFSVASAGMGRSLTSEKFNEAFEIAKKYSNGITCEEESFKKDIVKVSCLMLEDGYNMLTFLHKSISEYFAAAYVSRLSEGTAEKFYGRVLKSHLEWSEILRYLEKIDAYKFSKFHTLPSIESFFNSIELIEHSKANPAKILEKIFEFGNGDGMNIQFRTIDDFDSEDKYIQIGYHNFYGYETWHSEIQEIFINFLIIGIRLDIPTQLSEEEILSKGKKFLQVKYSGKKDEYHISLKDAIEIYGSENILMQIHYFEETLRTKLKAAKKLIHEEDSKEEIIDLIF